MKALFKSRNPVQPDAKPALPLAQQDAFAAGYNAAWKDNVADGAGGGRKTPNPFKTAEQRAKFEAGYKAAEGDGA